MGSATNSDAAGKELEEALIDVGKKLFRLPSSNDEILILLEEAEILLAQVSQLPSKSTKHALFHTMVALVGDKLLWHADVNIQLAVAFCLNELTRISAPDLPYNDAQMKEIFKLLMVALKQLSCGLGKNYVRAMEILETMAKVRSCLIMLDIDCEAMVVEMFQLFFNTIRSNQSSDISKFAETIMTMVIEECDNVSLELVRPLLASVRKDHKNVSPVSWELGKRVIEKCATRLRPSIKEGLKQMNLDVADYDEIIYCLCQDMPSGEDMALKNAAATVQSVADGQSGDEVSKLEGIPKAEQEDSNPQVKDGNQNMLDNENSVDTLKCCQQVVQRKNDDEIPDTAVNNSKTRQQSETNKGTFRRRRGRKPNSLIRPEEGYEHTWSKGRQDSHKVSRIGNETEDLSLPLELGKTNMPSDSLQREHDSVNEGSLRKRGRPKKKENMMNQQSHPEFSSNLGSKSFPPQVEDGGSDNLKDEAKRYIAGSSTDRVGKRDSGTDSNGKDKLLLQAHSGRKGRKEIKDGILFEKHEKKDVGDQMEESPIPKPAEDKCPRNLALKKEKKPRVPHADYGEQLVNSKIMVWWPLDKTFYTGTVEAFDPLTKKHKIKYDDDEQEELNLKREKWKLFNDERPQQVQSSRKREADHPSPSDKPVKIQKKMARRKAAGSSEKRAASSSKSVRSRRDGRSLVKSGDSAKNEPDDES